MYCPPKVITGKKGKPHRGSERTWVTSEKCKTKKRKRRKNVRLEKNGGEMFNRRIRRWKMRNVKEHCQMEGTFGQGKGGGRVGGVRKILQGGGAGGGCVEGFKENTRIKKTNREGR